MGLILSKLNKQQLAGLSILACVFLFACVEGLLHGTDPAIQNLGNVFSVPTWSEPLGTDQFGRSLLARMGAAIRLSLLLSSMCVLTSLLLGILLGVYAGWKGGSADRIVSFIVNMLLAMPGLVLILLLVALLPGSFFMLYVAISLVLWIEYFRVVRAVTQSVINSSPMQASRMLGFGRIYCFKRHIWPAIMPPVLTQAAFGAANSILAMAALGFVSVGLRPPTAELGLMMVELFPYYSDAPWALAQPIIAIFLIILGFYLLVTREKQ